MSVPTTPITVTKKPFAIIQRDHTDVAVKTVIRGTDEIVKVSLKFGNEAKFCKLCGIVIFSDLQYKDIRYKMKLVQSPMKRILYNSTTCYFNLAEKES